MGDLSPHFSRSEFACPHCGVIKVDRELVEKLELLRAAVGRPLVVRSGYRCDVHNRAVGGALHSQHLLGKACDLAAGYARVWQATAAGFRGVGRIALGSPQSWAVHVDVRAGAPVVFDD